MTAEAAAMMETTAEAAAAKSAEAAAKTAAEAGTKADEAGAKAAEAKADAKAAEAEADAKTRICRNLAGRELSCRNLAGRKLALLIPRRHLARLELGDAQLLKIILEIAHCQTLQLFLAASIGM